MTTSTTASWPDPVGSAPAWAMGRRSGLPRSTPPGLLHGGGVGVS
ncbi:hypothetical protein [Alloactinosynnema sp. L-07]|nr:hypothetical protein [Alloactinosynnema sp. L-07]